jgi:hypothetical protein
MSKNLDLVYTDKSGRRNPEYISLGCDSLPLLRGRTPIQVYSDYMRSFRNRFKDYLGQVITVRFCTWHFLVLVFWHRDELHINWAHKWSPNLLHKMKPCNKLELLFSHVDIIGHVLANQISVIYLFIFFGNKNFEKCIDRRLTWKFFTG